MLSLYLCSRSRSRSRSALITRALISCLSLSLSLGCGGAPRDSAPPLPPKPLPSWYLKPPPPAEEALYGVGEGKSHQESVQVALLQVAAQLKITVSSELKSQVKVKHEVESEEASILSRAQIGAVQLRGYELIEQHMHSPLKFYSLVRVDTRKLSQALQTELSEGLSELEAQLSPQSSALNLLRSCVALRERRGQLSAALDTLRSLSAEVSAFKRGLSALSNRCLQSAAQAHFSIKISGPSEAAELSQAALEVALTRRGLHLIDAQDKGADKAGVFHVKLEEQLSVAMGFQVVRWSAQLKLIEQSAGDLERGLSAHMIKVVGQSGGSVQEARQLAQTRLSERLKALELEALLGLDQPAER